MTRGARSRAARLVRALAASSLFAGAAWSVDTRFARADGSSPPDDEATAAAAMTALTSGRPADAIAGYESLADRGVVDPVLSFDRGLAYAARVRAGAEQPGDLGRAAHGFEEARDLGGSDLARRASSALTVVRTEIARRRAEAGEPSVVEQTPALQEAVVHLVEEDTWAALAAAASLLLGAALFVGLLASNRRVRVGAAVAAAIAGPVLLASAAFTAAARDDRLHARDAVVVAPRVRLADARGIALPKEPTLPEGARVRLVDSVGGPGGWSGVRWGAVEGWVPAGTVRWLAPPR